jgi:hypothetical protein
MVATIGLGMGILWAICEGSIVTSAYREWAPAHRSILGVTNKAWYKASQYKLSGSPE